jgi:hypothetical protein
VSAGKPSEPENYDQFVAEGIKVYIFKGAVISPEGIKISRQGDWRLLHNLLVEGLLYEQPIAG